MYNIHRGPRFLVLFEGLKNLKSSVRTCLWVCVTSDRWGETPGAGLLLSVSGCNYLLRGLWRDGLQLHLTVSTCVSTARTTQSRTVSGTSSSTLPGWECVEQEHLALVDHIHSVQLGGGFKQNTEQSINHRLSSAAIDWAHSLKQDRADLIQQQCLEW